MRVIGEPEAVIRNFTAMCCPGKKSGGWIPSAIASSKERTSSLSCFTAWTRNLRNPVQAGGARGWETRPAFPDVSPEAAAFNRSLNEFCYPWLNEGILRAFAREAAG